MDDVQLDFFAFEKAIKQLEKSLGFYDLVFSKKDWDMVEQLRAASIQAFEYTYELSWKTLERYLKVTERSVDVRDYSFFDLIRAGIEKKLLLGDIKAWRNYRKFRGATSYTYDEDKAAEVFAIIPQFLQEAKYLLLQLKEKTTV